MVHPVCADNSTCKLTTNRKRQFNLKFPTNIHKNTNNKFQCPTNKQKKRNIKKEKKKKQQFYLNLFSKHNARKASQKKNKQRVTTTKTNMGFKNKKNSIFLAKNGIIKGKEGDRYLRCLIRC